jgi:predicted nucleic acid-binding Zn ribbon protein
VSERGDRNEGVDPRAAPGGEGGLRGVLREVLGQTRLRRGVALGRLVRAWDAVVGTQLASQTVPKALEGGVLVVAASSPAWAVQVRFLADELRRRANGTLGAEVVGSVRVIVRPEAKKTLGHKGFGAQTPPPEHPPRGPRSDRI